MEATKEWVMRQIQHGMIHLLVSARNQKKRKRTESKAPKKSRKHNNQG